MCFMLHLSEDYNKLLVIENECRISFGDNDRISSYCGNVNVANQNGDNISYCSVLYQIVGFKREDYGQCEIYM